MGEKFDDLAPGEQSPENKACFQSALTTNLAWSLPFQIETPANPTFAFECSVVETVRKWAIYQSEEQKTGLEHLIVYNQTLSTTDGLIEAFTKLSELEYFDQMIIARALKAMALSNQGIADRIWKVISNEDWKQNVLTSMDELILGVITESLIMLQVSSQSKLFYSLPHYFADVCEKAETDERRRLFFFCVVYTSLASDTVSAIHRLLRGHQKAKYVELAKEVREHFEGTQKQYPEWVTGKIRGLIASL